MTGVQGWRVSIVGVLRQFLYIIIFPDIFIDNEDAIVRLVHSPSQHLESILRLSITQY